MSHELYNKWWIVTKSQLANLQVRDKILQKPAKPITSRPLANNFVGGLYARYSMVVQDLTACLDQNCLIQKNFTIKKLVDAAAFRLNELKDELTRINMSEYHYIDGNLIELKLIPHDIQILDPAYICARPLEIEDCWTKIKNGETIYIPPPPPTVPSATPSRAEVATETAIKPDEETVNAEAPAEQETKQQKEEAAKKRRHVIKYAPSAHILTEAELAAQIRKSQITEIVKIIQIHERARQARLCYMELDKRRAVRRRVQHGPPNLPDAEPQVQEAAANNIQRLWKGYAQRQHMKRRDEKRRLLIGMTEPSWKSTVEKDKRDKTKEERRLLRDRHVREYIQANLQEKKRVLRVIGPGLMEDIGDEIREWFYQWYKRARNFDKYPPEEVGGSILVVRGETMTPEAWLDEVERKRREKAIALGAGVKKDDKAEKEKAKKLEAEKKKKEKEKKKKEAAALKKKEAKGEFEYKFEKSNATERYRLGLKEYKEIWDKRPFEENPEQVHYMDMIHEQKCYEMQMELRPQVDILMRLELDLLNEALENDKARLSKKKHGKEKKGKGNKGSKQKGKKGKKDPTGDRTTEDLFQELVDNGIIRNYPEVHLEEFIGDFSYTNWDKRNLDFDPPATLGDVRQAVAMNCIMPLGVDTMVKPRSVLIVGHRQSGKHLLANAVFYETKCVLFDLSPPILAGKYPGKKGMKMLCHLIQKMSCLLQPSVIFIDGGEKPFYKKIPPAEKMFEPKRLGKKLIKGIVKPILPEDKVLVLAISGQPFAAKGKLQKAFERIILIPRTDYGSLYMYWRSLLMPYHGIDRNYNVSDLARISATYPLPTLKDVAQSVLIPRRIIQLKYRPLDSHEILDALIRAPLPVDDKEWNKFQKWFDKTPLAKKRVRYMKIADEVRAAEAKAAEKQKNK